MKTETHNVFTNPVLALIVACDIVLMAVQTEAGTVTNTYQIDTSLVADDDGSVNRDRYASFYHANYTMMFYGLSGPLPEQLPASRDTNGHWGPLVNGWQLSVRFRHGEFLTNEPVVAMITLRNVDAPFPSIFWRWPEAATRKNFHFVLRHGTNTLTWSWTDPPRPDPPAPGAPRRRYFATYGIAAGTQVPFFVRLDKIFDLSQAGQYTVQVSWPERSTTTESVVYREFGTNIVSGVAALRIVDKLSDTELEVRKTQEQTHQAIVLPLNELDKNIFEELARRAMTNRPSAK